MVLCAIITVEPNRPASHHLLLFAQLLPHHVICNTRTLGIGPTGYSSARTFYYRKLSHGWVWGLQVTYRVRARDARIRVMRRTLLIATCKNKAAQQRTTAIIVQYFNKVFYRYRQLTLVIQTTYIELQCDRCGSCECEEVEEALQA